MIAAMLALDASVSIASLTLATLALLGLVVRGKLGACLLFPVYLAVAALGYALILVAPERFWNWTFMAVTDAVQTALRVGIALEIAYRALRALPLGLRYIRRVFVGVCVLTVLAVLSFGVIPVDAFGWTMLLGRVTYGTAVLFTAFLLVVWRYGVPVDPLHRAIAAGFALASAMLAFAPVFSVDAEWGRFLLTKTAYPLVLLLWTVAAWRRDSLVGMSPQAVAILWPWRRP